MAKSNTELTSAQIGYLNDLKRYKKKEIIWNPLFHRANYGLNATQARAVMSLVK